MISSNWAFALVAVGHLDAARQRELDSVEAYRRAGDSEIRILGTELEVLRLDALQGRAAETLPEIESQLARLESWWEQRHAGIPAVESTEVEFLARSLIGVLDTAAFIHVAQDDWEPALRRFDAMLRVKRELQRPAEDLALDRRNRANALGHLGRREEAKAELESCLEIFRNDPAQSAMTLSSLADLFAEEGDLSHAIDLTRRGLAARELLPNPDQRATSHHSLAVYLARRGHPTDAIESLRHRLAALVYSIVAGFEYQLRAMMGGYIFHFRRAYNDGTELAVPRLAELLAVPAFRPLKRWLRSRRVRVMQVQEEVDGFLEAAREAALATARPSHADR